MSPTETPATRTESDTFGPIEVPAHRYWGAQTQRSIQNFKIGTEKMPAPLVHALGMVKQAAALVNQDLGALDPKVAQAVAASAAEVVSGEHDQEFPLVVWQTGSGTQSNMNANEVIASLANELLGGKRGGKSPVHPNDHVNRGQSSNDVFPTAMHMATAASLQASLLPALRALRTTLADQSARCADIVKIGRTHLQDATPLTLGEEMSGWVAQLDHAERAITSALPALHELAIGGTAVGNGLNTHPRFGELVAAQLAEETGLPLRCAPNRFAAMASHDAMVHAHAALKTLAVALTKIANDVRWLASGPRCGLGELRLPENEPGSSIMPGKVNPTQCEALTMVCCQVMGNDLAVTLGGASGHFELNAYKPLIVHNLLLSTRLLTDAIASFDEHCAQGMAPDRRRIDELLQRSLMRVTALAPHIGYERAAQIAQHALAHDLNLREAALALGFVTAGQLDAWLE